MLGDTVDTLNIYIRAGGHETLLWSLQGDQGDKWIQGIANLPTCASEFNIIIEGVRGTSFTGDIAIDDLAFDQCYEGLPPPTCLVSDPNQFMCQSQHCIPTANMCDYGLDCCDGSDESDQICYAYQRYNNMKRILSQSIMIGFFIFILDVILKEIIVHGMFHLVVNYHGKDIVLMYYHIIKDHHMIIQHEVKTYYQSFK